MRPTRMETQHSNSAVFEPPSRRIARAIARPLPIASAARIHHPSASLAPARAHENKSHHSLSNPLACGARARELVVWNAYAKRKPKKTRIFRHSIARAQPRTGILFIRTRHPTTHVTIIERLAEYQRRVRARRRERRRRSERHRNLHRHREMRNFIYSRLFSDVRMRACGCGVVGMSEERSVRARATVSVAGVTECAGGASSRCDDWTLCAANVNTQHHIVCAPSRAARRAPHSIAL